ncbi:MAG: F0F1 ATP synthase subunit B [Ruminococcaceae bacterium]|nr:F0F1 ATP synthase subunit B [Oscillospiraceae bacterium]
MMQSLEVISVNLWQILISLLNLLILFLLFKKFLFGPVNNMLAKRQGEIDARYEAADQAKRAAEEDKLLWDEKIGTVKAQTDEMMKKAQDSARRQSETIVSKAKEQADGIIRQAETQAQLEMKKAEEGIKQEIVEVSTALANKLLAREINADDHRELIDSFIEKIGDGE